jgi:hypothetical protein
MHRTKTDKKYFQKIYRNVLSRKTRFYHRNVALNGVDTNIKAVLVRKHDSVLKTLGGLNQHDNNICYFLINRKSFDTFFFHGNVDVVVVDSFYRVVAIFDNVLPNQTLTIPKNARHI